MTASLRRLPFLVCLLVGLALGGLLLGVGQHDAAEAAQDVLDGASPLVEDGGVEQIRVDLDHLAEVDAALRGPGTDALARLSGRLPDVFTVELAARHPEVAAAAAEVPEVAALAETVVGNLEKRVDQFASAASLPGGGLSLPQAVLAQLLLAAVVVVIAAAGLMRPHRGCALALAVLGLGLALGPLAAGYPAKAADTDALLDSLRPFSTAKVEARQAGLAAVRAYLDGYRNDVLPGVANEAGLTTEAVQGVLASVDPALSADSLAEVDRVLTRFDRLVEFSAEAQPLLVRADTISATTLTWSVVGSGALLLLAGSLGMLALRRDAPR